MPSTGDAAVCMSGKYREIFKSLEFITRKISFSLSFLFFLQYLCEKVVGSQAYCANYFTMKIDQTTILHTSNLYGDVWE